MELEHFDACQRLEADGVLAGYTLVVQVFGDASGAVATHHGFGAVVVEDAHGEVGIGAGGCTDEDESVAANAEVWLAPQDGGCRGVWYSI